MSNDTVETLLGLRKANAEAEPCLERVARNNVYVEIRLERCVRNTGFGHYVENIVKSITPSPEKIWHNLAFFTS